MAKEGQSGLEAITGVLSRAGKGKGPPPVERLESAVLRRSRYAHRRRRHVVLHEDADRRPALVKLFASVLKREGDKYFLVTPVEKCGIQVDDAPFLAVELNIDESSAGRVLNFRTNVDDWVACGPAHALRFEPQAATGGLKPYLHVRRDLWAKVTRTLFFDLSNSARSARLRAKRCSGLLRWECSFPWRRPIR